MIYVLTTIHVLVCFFLIIIVLLQSGKAADLAGAFGGMGSQTAFGPRGAATVLSKATTVSAVLFMVTSITLSIYEMRRGGASGSVLDSRPKSAPAPASKTPGAPAKRVPVPAPQAPNQPFTIEVPTPPKPAGTGKKAPAAPNISVETEQAPPATPKAPAAPAKK